MNPNEYKTAAALALAMVEDTLRTNAMSRVKQLAGMVSDLSTALQERTEQLERCQAELASTQDRVRDLRSKLDEYEDPEV